MALISVKRLSQPQGHSVAGRIKSMKNTNDPIGNRTHDLLACSAVPQPTAPPCTPFALYIFVLKLMLLQKLSPWTKQPEYRDGLMDLQLDLNVLLKYFFTMCL
jgi:hypothetical protein